MNRNLNLNWLRTFEATARYLSFTTASKELGLTQTAVSLQIKSLETKLGHDLFIRRPKSLKLTEIGKAYLPSVRDSLFALKLCTNGLFGPDLATTIVVRASIALIVWLAPKLNDFQQQYPGTGIKFVTAIWTDTIDTQNVDIDIALAPNSRASSHLEKLSDEFLVPICGLNTSETVITVDDLSRFHPIHILGFDDHWSRYLAEFNLQYDVRSTRLQVDTFIAACELVSCDLGCAIVLERFATNAIETGRPIKCVGERVPLNHSHFLVGKNMAKEIQPEVEAFKDWLRTWFNA
ncbi:MAG: LysR family transcriptional regulator [Gammaproteobacteria bacterium]|nr:LysR family transcriptional regulator [Gammaproteobacteria bacterium]